jgi:hypothetical protein
VQPNQTIKFTDEVVFNENKANVQFYKIGKLITINYQGETKAHTQNELIFKIPQKYAPRQFIPVPFIGQNNAYFGVAGISTDGAVRITSISNTQNTGRLYMNFSYVLD